VRGAKCAHWPCAQQTGNLGHDHTSVSRSEIGESRADITTSFWSAGSTGPNSAGPDTQCARSLGHRVRTGLARRDGDTRRAAYRFRDRRVGSGPSAGPRTRSLRDTERRRGTRARCRPGSGRSAGPQRGWPTARARRRSAGANSVVRPAHPLRVDQTVQGRKDQPASVGVLVTVLSPAAMAAWAWVAPWALE